MNQKIKEAIEYLVKETKLSKEECSAAYDFLIKIEDFCLLNDKSNL